jgi:DNA-directed RNA polymerase specialized sigma subunit
MNPEMSRRVDQIKARMPGKGNRAPTVDEIAGLLSVERATVQEWLGSSMDHLDFAKMSAGDHNIRVQPDELVRFVVRRLGTMGSLEL